ncbi:MAG: DUF5666 domain-containing protein [Patescibacteria group bacterium]|nr:DUF5666 domain-containing protein [Patescibacteria group bacterium]
MKKILAFSLGLLAILAIPGKTLAVVSTSSSEASKSRILRNEQKEQVKDLRERVATKVAELKEKMRRAWSGDVKLISGKTITLTVKNSDKTVVTDENTLFFRIGTGAKKIITLDDLDTGEKIVAFGQANEETSQMTAKIIIAKVLPFNLNGKVTAVDAKTKTLTVSAKKGNFTVMIDTNTKILLWEKGQGLNSAELSQIKIGDRVHVNGLTPVKSNTQITAKRILVLPGKALGITGENTPVPTASPSSTPKASPTPKPKTSPTPTPTAQ